MDKERWQETALLVLRRVGLCVGAKPNVLPKAFGMRLAKIVFKKVRREKNKKHRVGNEFRLALRPFVISFLCLCSPVKMVYFFRLNVCLSMVVVSSAMLAPNVGAYCVWLILKTYLSHVAERNYETKTTMQHFTILGFGFVPTYVKWIIRTKLTPLANKFRKAIP